MKTFLIALVIVLFSFPSKEKKIIIEFNGAADKLNTLQEKTNDMLLVGNDPRWAITVKIYSVKGQTSLMKKGDTKIFGIHSPSKLFGSDDERNITGRTYDFELTCEIPEKGDWRYLSLKVK
jgi:hypothetical protein